MIWVANSIIMPSLTDYRGMPAARASFGEPELAQRILYGLRYADSVTLVDSEPL